jgi:tRNA(Arg) A34 adenosine deaminase TadA
MNPEEAVKLAMQVAEQGMRKGEMPIGSVVLQGDKIIGRGYTQEKELKRRIVHADLMAMIEADARLGFNRSILPLKLKARLLQKKLLFYYSHQTSQQSCASYGLSLRRPSLRLESLHCMRYVEGAVAEENCI